MIASMMLAACAAPPPPAEAPAATEPPAEAPAATEPPAEAPAAEAVEVEFWYIPFTLEEEALQAVIDAFQAANPDVKIKEVLVQYEEITQKVAAQVPKYKFFRYKQSKLY